MSGEKQKIEYSPAFVGEHIKDAALYSVLGGDELGFQLVEIIGPETNLSLSGLKNIEVTGPPLSEIRSKSPFGLILKIKVNEASVDTSKIPVRDLEAVIEKKLGDFINQIEGVSHQFVRDEIEIRISHKAVENGLTFDDLAAILNELITEEFPFVAGVFFRVVTDEKTGSEESEKARGIYKKRDERALSLHDEDVKTFYGCKICQISSPAHVCVITPDRPSVCGTINWFEARAACLSNPDGPVFEIEKGELIDAKSGEYSGVSAAVAAGSGGENSRVLLYSLTENPHTTGSVFDVIAFIIPEVGGIGLIDRTSKSPAVNCLTFDEMMMFTGYGQQISGFSGVGETYMMSEKFLQKEGGWDNIVWMTQSLKDRMIQKIQALNPEKYEKLLNRILEIPTENDVTTCDELQRRQ
ncbi:MAG: acetyl-CoA decarbonylase/synthase complex subunit beta [Methanimicrococcus sp.]|nr:acetyl-CoA decarbonylase/synthase complex subunit beta [Methanimicrococcus sp.]